MASACTDTFCESKSGCTVNTSIRESPVSHSESPMTHFSKRERHARTPDSVLLDKNLSITAKAVYPILSRHSFRDGRVYIGQRRAAELLRTSQRTISRSIQELARRGHAKYEPLGRGKRGSLKLLSNIFQPIERKRHNVQRQGLSSVVRSARGEKNAAAARDAILGA